MNKSELTAAVARNSGMTLSNAGNAVSHVLEVIATTLRSGEEVRLRDFGNFSIKERDAHVGRNPATGEAIEIAASKSVKFKATKGLV